MNQRLEIPEPPTVEKESQMMREAGGCDSCLLWHKFCKAECCKQVYFKLHLRRKPRAGQTVIIDFPEEIPADMKWYFELHGFRVEKSTVFIKLVKFKYKDGLLCVYRTCDLLGDDLKCQGHPDKKPLVCQELDLNSAMKKKFVLTPNCMFKYQMRLEDGDNR